MRWVQKKRARRRHRPASVDPKVSAVDHRGLAQRLDAAIADIDAVLERRQPAA